MPKCEKEVSEQIHVLPSLVLSPQNGQLAAELNRTGSFLLFGVNRRSSRGAFCRQKAGESGRKTGDDLYLANPAFPAEKNNRMTGGKIAVQSPGRLKAWQWGLLDQYGFRCPALNFFLNLQMFILVEGGRFSLDRISL